MRIVRTEHQKLSVQIIRKLETRVCHHQNKVDFSPAEMSKPDPNRVKKWKTFCPLMISAKSVQSNVFLLVPWVLQQAKHAASLFFSLAITQTYTNISEQSAPFTLHTPEYVWLLSR